MFHVDDGYELTEQTQKMVVRFATTVITHTAFYILQEGEADPDLWYNDEDPVQFRANMIQDSFGCIEMMARARRNDAGLTKEEVASCIGLEVLLTPNMLRRVQATKTMHLEVISVQQTLQRMSGVQDEQNLADLSSASSQWSRDRSTAIANRYFQLS
jgi:hypothetical protein